jgi:hypothetical protein
MDKLKEQATALKGKAEELKGKADALHEQAIDFKIELDKNTEHVNSAIKAEVLPQAVLISESVRVSPAWIRLESQINWHQNKSRKSRKKHKLMQFFQVTMAISIPAIVHIDLAITKWIISLFGALIAILESMQYMNQYEVIWISHREIAERLKREKFLFLSAAGHYQGLVEIDTLKHLAERVEEIVSIGATNETKETNSL